MARLTISDLHGLKAKKQKILMLTAYNYPFARILDKSSAHVILVGDSLGNTQLGFDSTVHVTMEDMCRATGSVARGSENKFIVADMPFLSYHTTPAAAVENAGQLMRAGAQAVKMEGAHHLEAVRAIINTGIPVMGHLGFTPQSVNKLGGYKVQGKTEAAAQVLFEEAKQLEEAGVFAIVLEMVPQDVARMLGENLDVITIGIGAGKYTDGQVLVTDDIIGLYDRFKPKFVKQYMTIARDIENAVNTFCEEVQSGEFPGQENSY